MLPDAKVAVIPHTFKLVKLTKLTATRLVSSRKHRPKSDKNKQIVL